MVDLDTPIQYLKGVGPRLAAILGKVGVKTIEDLLFYFPREFEDRRFITPIKSLKLGENQLIRGKIIDTNLEKTKRGFTLFKAMIDDGEGVAWAIWFNQPFLQKVIKVGRKILVYGKAEYNRFDRLIEFSVRDYEILRNGEWQEGKEGIVPVYSLTEGLFQKKLRKIMKGALDKHLPEVEDSLPAKVKALHSLLDLREAIYNFHFPEDKKVLPRARHRLVFDDFFVFQLGLALKRDNFSQRSSGVVFNVDGPLTQKFATILPFKLTGAQEKVIAEIKKDMQSSKPMNRLLQGDVGSGKTAVALFALLVAVQNGCQGAIMAPTEILAQQHYFKIKDFLKSLNISVAILTSSLSAAEKGRIQEDIAKGKISIVIGTHALIQGKVKFKKLGLIIVDEQHRFGVLQRASLKEKGYNPDMLVMTATPIPRTLALTLYGDLERSVISELPPGRQKIKTAFRTEEKRGDVYEFLRREMREGRQIYVVCPLVEESEESDLKAAVKMSQELQKRVFPEFKVGLMHGRLSGEEKEEVMRAFAEKKIDLLVSTTVIEVGIDVANATVMLVEHAERFGLSQLHQLRGRIGRGAAQSYCILLGNPKTEEGKKRIEAMLKSSDGFEIAEVDLSIRGPGEFYGIRQSGLPNFRVADIIKDEEILRTARRVAFEVVVEDPRLEKPENKLLKRELLRRYGEFLELGALN